MIIDNCAVDQLAELGLNPALDFAGTEFTLVFTPDLKLEYRRGRSASPEPFGIQFGNAMPV